MSKVTRTEHGVSQRPPRQVAHKMQGRMGQRDYSKVKGQTEMGYVNVDE